MKIPSTHSTLAPENPGKWFLFQESFGNLKFGVYAEFLFRLQIYNTDGIRGDWFITFSNVPVIRHKKNTTKNIHFSSGSETFLCLTVRVIR